MTMTVSQFRRTVGNSQEIALAYPKGSAMLSRYIELNGYSRIVPQKHHHNEDCWQVWMMNGESTGTYTLHRTRRDARLHAERLSEHTGLPIDLA